MPFKDSQITSELKKKYNEYHLFEDPEFPASNMALFLFRF